MNDRKADITGNIEHKSIPVEKIGPYTPEEFINQVTSFHCYVAPGVIMGGIMVSMAMEQIPEGVLFNVICETSSCLPDSVQLLTPCTIGNGRLRIINLGRYAVSLYDKDTGRGVRIYLDLEKLKSWDEIHAWLFKLKPRREQDSEKINEQIWKAGRDIYTFYQVQIKPEYLTKYSKGAIGTCRLCGEVYPVKDGEVCLGCQGEAPYDVT
jgi:formylmethanofuran dehydrogenase subunit E